MLRIPLCGRYPEVRRPLSPYCQTAKLQLLPVRVEAPLTRRRVPAVLGFTIAGALINMYPLATLAQELEGYELRKGTVHFPYDKPVPVKLISRIAKLRAAGIARAR